MGNIVLLDELTINKIAAGEVIERPASVVKEMIENSIDAGATNISVEIQNGGISKIRIVDNGKGIAKDDMHLAFERHATSKIRVADDLETVRTMGFRGEALASIAAISRIEMISRTEESEIGNKIVVEGGKILEETEIAAAVGTTITVENLFYNTPVRYKFLKKDYTEAGYIEDVVTRIALVNSNIAVKLINSGKTVIRTNGNGEIKNVIYSIYGKEIAEAIVDVDYEYEGIKVTGVVGKPEIARSSRICQQFFVNGRYIKDKTLSAASEQAFKGMIPGGKFGFLVLNVQVMPEKVDVNVHPAKLEVRFQEENKVFKAVMYAIKEGLLQDELVKNVTKTDEENNYEIEHESKKSNFAKDIFKKISKPEEDFGKTENLIEDLYNIRQEKNPENIDYTKIIPKIDMDDSGENIMPASADSIEEVEEFLDKPSIIQKNPELFESTIEIVKETGAIVKEKEINYSKVEKYDNVDFDQMYEKTFGDVPASLKQKEETFKEIKYADNISFFDKNKKYSDYKYIGSAFSTYIILEIGEDLYMIDQHAAHERIMYEKVKKNFYSEENKDSQILLIPDIINLTHKEMLIARENFDVFEKAGFVVEEFGENTIKLSGVPNMCIDLDTKTLFLDILDEIDTVARTERQEVEEKFIATVACKSAVKANNTLGEPEVRALMGNLLELQNPFTCPHGRPTAIKMTKIDFEKKFNRKQ